MMMGTDNNTRIIMKGLIFDLALQKIDIPQHHT